MSSPSDHVFADPCASVTLSDNLNVLSDGDTIARSILPNANNIFEHGVGLHYSGSVPHGPTREADSVRF